MPQWYYGSPAGQTGPVGDDEIRALIASGAVAAETLVWRDGMQDWTPMRMVPELNGYPVNPYQAPYQMVPAYYPQPIPNSGLAIASMVCGIVGYCTCYFVIVLAIPAVICGHLALSQIKNSPTPLGGRGMAIAGLILGYLAILCTVGVLLSFGIAIATNPH